MRKTLLLFVVLFIWTLAFSQGEDSLLIMFWNVENFFDYFNDGQSASDKEFSSFGNRHWSKRKFFTKCNGIAKTVLWVAEESGRLPDAIGLAEVENSFVLRKLLQETALRKTDYSYIHYDSPDHRGIDVALLYRRSSLRLLQSKPLRVRDSAGELLGTRDVLLADFLVSSGENLCLFVNHHPSKYGGGDTDWKREAALMVLNTAVDSLRAEGRDKFVAMGDFNDTPEKPIYSRLSLENLALPLAMEGKGSIRYGGKWELIDMFFIDKTLAPYCKMEIVKPPFLIEWDNVHAGEKPFRTWQGPRYKGGVSDHLPILLRLNLNVSQ